jgi:ribosome biogenesis protein Nip4
MLQPNAGSPGILGTFFCGQKSKAMMFRKMATSTSEVATIKPEIHEYPLSHNQ